MCGLEVAKRVIVALGHKIDPEACKMIPQGYVEDASGDEDLAAVDRLIGKESWDQYGSPSYSGTMARIMALGNFNIKVTVHEGAGPAGDQCTWAALGHG